MSITKKVFVGAFVAAFALVAMKADAAYVHTTTLKFGSKGAQVVALQQALNAGSCKVATVGVGSAGMESMTFGQKTKAAVMCFQAANGLTADGVVGPMTGAKIGLIVAVPAGNPNTPCPAGYVCTPSGNNNGGSTNLSGSEGTISDVTKIASLSNEQVGDGQNAVKVLGFDVKTSKDGDIAIKSVKVKFTYLGSGSTRLNNYIDGVTVWEGSTKVGSANVDDFNKDSSGVYSLIVPVNSAVVKADSTSSFYVSVDAANSLDSSNIGASPDWNIQAASLRYVDGSGVTTTDSSTGFIGTDVGINFVDFNTAADTELRISKDTSSPAAGIVVVDKTNTTNGVSLLKGSLRLTGKSDVTINTIPVTVTTATSGLASMADSVTLVLNGKEYSQSTVATTAGSSTVTFDNLDFKLNAGDSVSFEVKSDINGTNNYTPGATMTAAITGDNRSAMDVENTQGDQVLDSAKTGTAIGDAQEFRAQGVSATLVSTDATVDTTNTTTLGTYTLKFKVTAVGDDAYIGTAAAKYGYALVDANGTATTAGVSATITNEGGSGNSTTVTTGGNWKVNEGTSVTLTLQVFVDGGSIAGGAYRAQLNNLKWDTIDQFLSNTYNSNLTDFHTGYKQLI